MNRETMNSH